MGLRFWVLVGFGFWVLATVGEILDLAKFWTCANLGVLSRTHPVGAVDTHLVCAHKRREVPSNAIE